jgi:hypothetical protein
MAPMIICAVVVLPAPPFVVASVMVLIAFLVASLGEFSTLLMPGHCTVWI